MLTANDLAFMRATELQAMSSTGQVLRVTYTETPLGNQSESWSSIGTVSCDIWPISRQGNETSSGNQEISEKHYYLSVPYNADITVEDKVVISDVIYDVIFVPIEQSWLTNLRLEVRNYNGQLYIIETTIYSLDFSLDTNSFYIGII